MKVKWAGHAARMGYTRMHIIYLLENLKGRDYLEDVGVDGSIILEWMLGK